MRDGRRDALRLFGLKKTAGEGEAALVGLATILGYSGGQHFGMKYGPQLAGMVDPKYKESENVKFLSHILGGGLGGLTTGALAIGVLRPHLKTALHPAAWGAIIGTPIGAGAGYYVAPKDESPYPYMAGGALSGGLLGTSLGGLAGLLGGTPKGVSSPSPSAPSPPTSPSSPSSSSGRAEIFRVLTAPIVRNVREGKITAEEGAGAIHAILQNENS